MTKSRTLPALFLLALIRCRFRPSRRPDLPRDEPPLPQPGTPDAADHRHRRRGDRDGPAPACATSSRPNVPPGQLEEVVVCGRRPGYQRWRVPFRGPDVSPGTRARAGDAQLYAMDAGGTRCSAVGRDQQCGGGLDIIGIGFAIVRGVAQALANRD